MVIQVIRALQIYKYKHIAIRIIDTADIVSIKSLNLLFFIYNNGMRLNINVNTDSPNKSSIKCIFIPPIFFTFEYNYLHV